MQANAELHDRGPRYTETPRDPYSPDAPFVAEPWNAVTASFFVFIAVAWLIRLRGRYRDFPFLMCCLPILLAGRHRRHALSRPPHRTLLLPARRDPDSVAGSVRGRVHRDPAVEAPRLDVSPAVRSSSTSATSVLLFTMVLPRSRQLAVNLNYAALATMIVLPIAHPANPTRFRHASWFVAGVLAFVIAWFFRLWDEHAGPYMPMGSHWLWHTFGAISTALVIEFFYKVEGRGFTTETPRAQRRKAEPESIIGSAPCLSAASRCLCVTNVWFLCVLRRFPQPRFSAPKGPPLIARGGARLCERNPWYRVGNKRFVCRSPEGAIVTAAPSGLRSIRCAGSLLPGVPLAKPRSTPGY